MKKLVIGNACIDGILDKDVSIDVREYSVVLQHGQNKIEIHVKAGPIKAGGKYTAKTDFCHALQNFPRKEQFGGGGYLSATTLRKISNDEIYYLDLSTPSLDTSIPGTSLADKLDSMDIDPHFISARPMPFNIVLGERSDKIIVKSILGNPIFGEYAPYLVNTMVGDCDGILFNSLKDTLLVELAIKGAREGKKVVCVITNSLDPDYVLKSVIPYCSCQFNYDEFGYIINPEHKVIGDEETRIESAFQGLARIRHDYNQKDNMYVTLGKNGLLFSDASKIYHIRLKDEILEKVHEVVNKNPTSTCGAGDAHAASVFNDELSNLPIMKIAQRATCTSLRYLGYDVGLNPTDFQIKTINEALASIGG